jgi:hypothetical protein
MSRLLALCDNDTTLTQALHASVLSAWLESWSDSLVEEQLLLSTLIIMLTSSQYFLSDLYNGEQLMKSTVWLRRSVVRRWIVWRA